MNYQRTIIFGCIPRLDRQRLAIFWAAAACALVLMRVPGNFGTAVTAAEPKEKRNQSDVASFVSVALNPFWRASEIREPVFFIRTEESKPPVAKFLFIPTKVLSVTSATRDTTFDAGKDFEVDLHKGVIRVARGSRIPVKTQEEMYPLMTSNLPKIARHAGDGTRGIFFGEGSAYHQLQEEVHYTFKPGQWNGPVPEYAGDKLPRTVAKLRGKQPVNLMLCGDSISAGANATLVTNAPPGCPDYGRLVALALEKHFGSKVTFTNHAVGGWTSGNGLQHARDQHIGKASPNLVVIAFGMNDVFQRDAVAYQANVRGIMDAIRADAPDAEFILVASMLGNKEWGIPVEQFPLYREALAKLCGPGVVLADLTSMWEALLQRKSFYDLTGNGVNHPNDFGHTVYAQVILSLLMDETKEGTHE
jgi:lysophospholipase L1-like esterase